MKALAFLAERRRFGMKPGLDSITRLLSALGNPQRDFKAVHVAGTNGKGAVAAMLEAALRKRAFKVGRYTSPHLVKTAERFFLNGAMADEATLERLAAKVEAHIEDDVTFFEALTAVAFALYSEEKVDYAVMECGLGGRLDATNVCNSAISIITRIGLDHCDWLGDTLAAIASEKAGIVKSGVPVVLGENAMEVREVVERKAKAVGAPFYYAPEIVDEEVPPLALAGAFNRENAITALATLKILTGSTLGKEAFSEVVWPGRFQRVGRFLVDGAHNPPAATALAFSLKEAKLENLDLIAGFCGDKDVDAVLQTLAPFVKRGFAVKTENPRSLAASETAERMQRAGIAAKHSTLEAALRESSGATLVCGSLFLVGEALVKLGAYPWGKTDGLESAEILKV